MATLLEQALELPRMNRKTKYSEEDMELALAWAQGKVSTGQVTIVWDVSSGAIYAYLAGALKAAISSGKVTISCDPCSIERQPR